MFIYDLREMGNRLLSFRKKAGLTQAEAAEKAGLSDRTYADIERGKVNMRVETLLKICDALQITPNDILVDLTEEIKELENMQKELLEKMEAVGKFALHQNDTAMELLKVYLKSVK